MTISLTNLIADIEAKIAAANSSTSTDELLKIIKAARAANTIANTYDSAGVMPVDSANVGNVLLSASNNFLYVLDSAGGSWSSITGSGGAPEPPWSFQGSSTGYQLGGKGPTTYNTIDKWPFATDENATDVGDLTIARYHIGGHSSSTHGYASGGYYQYNTIDNFPFASGGNASDVGDLTIGRTSVGHSSQTHAYSSGNAYSESQDIIEKWPFASGGNATDVGNLLTAAWYNAGISSQYYGYNAGGVNPNDDPTNVIQKFSVTADGNATDVGNLTVAREVPTGTNSDTHGYTAGSTNPYYGAGTTVIDKFPFATDTDATDVGDVTNRGNGSNGQSSTSSGYLAGGYGAPPSPAYKNIIEKYSFSSDGNATDVGDLTIARWSGAGAQV